MNKVSLTLECPDTPATDLEHILDTLRPVIALITYATVHVTIIEED